MKIEKLYPEFKDYIWGGEKLKERYGKKTKLSPCAESWELSFHKDGLTKLSDGTPLPLAASECDLGTNLKKFEDFPLLIKFIDAKSDLSVQVHPSDSYAMAHEGGFGKTEMWYVVEADDRAGIYLGFKSKITEEDLVKAIEEETLCELLNFVKVKKGDCFFIPAGTIHAIGGGCLICEIQQNSNLTYRVYDYGRRDKNGNKRELHVKKALEVTSLEVYCKEDFGEYLGRSEYFAVKSLSVIEKTTLSTDGSTFHALCCISGCGTIDGQPISAGDTYFVPASHGSYTLQGDMTLLQTFVE